MALLLHDNRAKKLLFVHLSCQNTTKEWRKNASHQKGNQ